MTVTIFEMVLPSFGLFTSESLTAPYFEKQMLSSENVKLFHVIKLGESYLTDHTDSSIFHQVTVNLPTA